MADTQWLLDFYTTIAKAAPKNNGVLNNFEYTFKFDDIQNTFPTVQDTGYSANKNKQLERHYWNDQLDGYISGKLKNGETDFSFVPQGEPKKQADNKNKDFCLSNVQVTIKNNVMDLNITTRASEPYQVLLADLWFFNKKMREFATPLGITLGSFHFVIQTSNVYSFAVRTYNQLRLVTSRTPAERVDYFEQFLDCFYPHNRMLAFRMASRYLTYFLPEVNPTPTYAKLKAGHKTCHNFLDQAQRDRIKTKLHAMFPNEILGLQEKRNARKDNKFINLI